MLDKSTITVGSTYLLGTTRFFTVLKVSGDMVQCVEVDRTGTPYGPPKQMVLYEFAGKSKCQIQLLPKEKVRCR